MTLTVLLLVCVHVTLFSMIVMLFSLRNNIYRVKKGILSNAKDLITIKHELKNRPPWITSKWKEGV